MTDRHTISAKINGEARVADADARMLLVDFLRDCLQLTGTHVGCEHGVCGACTVIINGQAARSCLMFAVQIDGAVLQTIEGLAGNREMHPLQKLFSEHRALQCGFCQPGMILAAKALLKDTPKPSDDQIRQALANNLCRCTGYTKIFEAVRLAAGIDSPRPGVDERPAPAPPVDPKAP